MLHKANYCINRMWVSTYLRPHWPLKFYRVTQHGFITENCLVLSLMADTYILMTLISLSSKAIDINSVFFS